MMIRRFEMAIAIDDHRSFQRAARALGISQPALTRALQTLETEFGARLFERGKNECEPTPFGHIVLTHARRVVSEVSEARREIGLLTDLKSGEFRIGMGSAGPQQWLGGAIGDLCAANPELRVRIVELAGLHMPDSLMAGEIDVAVGEPCELDNYPDIVLARLPRRPISFFCRKGHPLTQQPEPTLRDIGMFPFVGPRLKRRWGVHLPTNPVFGSMSADGKYFEPAILCPNWATILDIVRRSDVISARSRALVETPEHRADLAILPFVIPELHTEHSIMWRADRMPHPALKAFRDAVRRNEAIVMGDTGAIQVAA